LIIGNGPHKQLISLNGENLLGIFSHGNSQAYGSQYINNLQTAALYIGLRTGYQLKKDKKLYLKEIHYLEDYTMGFTSIRLHIDFCYLF
jgi:hypothetical protein